MIQKILIGAIGLILIGAIAVYIFPERFAFLGLRSDPINSARFLCDDDKRIEATFYEGEVALTLHENFQEPRKMTLAQLVSASGARYGNADESFIFWNKGDTAFITEGERGETFSNCEVESAGAEARAAYASSTLGISFKYPRSFAVSEYQYLGFPQKPINGVKVQIPLTMATGTNLSSDTYVSVEQLPRAVNCTGDIFIVDNVRASEIIESGVEYSVATTSGAGAGNLYEEIVYALAGSKPCTGVRYYIHSTNIGNYEPGAVREFDRAALLAEFDAVRSSLRLSATSTAAQ